MKARNRSWSRWWVPFDRCPARREDYARCDLSRGHDGDHALERGMDLPRWSTDWTA